MLKFICKNSEQNKKLKLWDVYDDSLKSNKSFICTLNISPVVKNNKFPHTIEIIEDINKSYPTFGKWICRLFKDYVNNEYDISIILSNLDNIIRFSNKFINKKKLEFSKYVDMKKKSKTSIIFTEENIHAIIQGSISLRVYMLFSMDENMSIPDDIHRSIYNKLISQCITTGTHDKIFQLIRSKTYNYYLTDSIMWKLMDKIYSETPGSYMMSLFNKIMNTFLPILDINRNPISFLVGFIDNQIGWLLRTVYKDDIIYGDLFNKPDEISGSDKYNQSFNIYAYNNFITRCVDIAFYKLENDFKLSETDFELVKQRLENVQHIYAHSKLITFPIYQKMFKIPYNYLNTISPKHASLLGILLYYYLYDSIFKQYNVIGDLIISVPKQVSLSTNKFRNASIFITNKSSYKLKNLENIINNNMSIFGIENKNFKYDILSSISGVLSSSRKDLINILNGKNLNKVKNLDVEDDVCDFFLKFYNNKFDNDIELAKKEINNLI